MTANTLVHLGEIASEVKRKAPSGSPLPVYSVTKHRGFVPSLEYFKKQVFSRDTKGYKHVMPGELAYATIHLDEGSLGACPEPSLISPMYTVFRLDERRADVRYVERFLKSPRALSIYPMLAKGAVHRRAAISFGSLAGISIPLPTLSEQRRIAAALDKADDLRTKRREAISKLDRLLQSVFLDMFGDPVANPKNWPMPKVGEVFSDFVGGKNVECPDVSSSPYRILKVSAVTSKFYRPDESKPAPEDFVPSLEAVVREGDLLFSRANTTELVAATALVWETPDDIVLPDKIWKLRIAGGVQARNLYLWELFKNSAFRYELSKRSSGTSGSMKNISKSKLKLVPMPLPPVELQDRFSEISKSVHKQLHSFKRALSDSDSLFASLQDKVFSRQLI